MEIKLLNLENLAQPKYSLIANEILKDIQSDKYAVGDLLPTETNLVENYQTSRFTIREALRNLVERGYISRKRGSGTRVLSKRTSPAFVYRLSSVAEILKYPEDTRRENLFTGTIHADPILADKIDCPIGKTWFRISGIRCSDESDSPISWSDIYVLPEFAEFLKEFDDGRVPIYEVIEMQTGISIVDAEVRIFASSIDGRLAKLMQVSLGTPALTIIRKYKDHNGRNFETTLTVHPEKRFEYSMKFHREMELTKA